MTKNFFAAEPIYLTLSDMQGTLLYREVIWNIMRMILMSEGDGEWDYMDAESALKTLDEMPIEQFDKLKAVAEIEYASPRFQEYMERIHLYPGTASAPELQPVLDENGVVVYGLITYKNGALESVLGTTYLNKMLKKLHLKKEN